LKHEVTTVISGRARALALVILPPSAWKLGGVGSPQRTKLGSARAL
jgi:hypothetical protein